MTDTLPKPVEADIAEAVEQAIRDLPGSKLVDRDQVVDVLLDLRRRFTSS
jgi:hypothetical protein